MSEETTTAEDIGAQKAYQNANSRLRDNHFDEFVVLLNEERRKAGLHATIPNVIPEGWEVTLTRRANGNESA